MRLKLAIALITVYLVWGSTYLAIAVANRSLPPLLMLSVRFLIAGALLYGWSRLARRRRGRASRQAPVARGRRSSARCCSSSTRAASPGPSSASRRAPRRSSSRASRSSSPCSIARSSASSSASAPPRASPRGSSASGCSSARARTIDLLGAVVILVASFAWAAGSVYARVAPLPRKPDRSRPRCRCSPPASCSESPASPWARARASTSRRDLLRVARRGRVPDRLRLARRVHRVRLAAARTPRRRCSRPTPT